MMGPSSRCAPPRPGTEAFPRRLFLKRSLRLAGAVTLLPAGLGGCARSDEVRVPADLRVLSEDEYRIADAFADTLIPAGGDFEAGARSLQLTRRLDAFLAHESAPVVDGVASALWTLEYGGILLAGRVGRFTAMTPDSRTRYLEKLPLGFEIGRTIYLGLKRSFYFLFYNIDATWQYVGYDGPWVGTDGSS